MCASSCAHPQWRSAAGPSLPLPWPPTYRSVHGAQVPDYAFMEKWSVIFLSTLELGMPQWQKMSRAKNMYCRKHEANLAYRQNKEILPVHQAT